jgi:hypothetical protein
LAFVLVARAVAMNGRCNVAQELVQQHITKMSRDQAYLGMVSCRLGRLPCRSAARSDVANIDRLLRRLTLTARNVGILLLIL